MRNRRPATLKAQRARYRRRHRTELRRKAKLVYARNRNGAADKAKQRAAQRRTSEPEKTRAEVRNWHHLNREKRNKGERAWAQANPEKRKAQLKRFRSNAGPNYKLAQNLRNRINRALHGRAKSASTITLLGCSIDSFWIYLESRFEPGMTRQNYGSVWEVDHEIPCALFDLTRADHQRRCFHFSNLQPLFAEANRRKSYKTTATVT